MTGTLSRMELQHRNALNDLRRPPAPSTTFTIVAQLKSHTSWKIPSQGGEHMHFDEL
jgi:hypothetical protein